MAQRYEVGLTSNVPLTMRDGVTLYADIYTPEGERQFPILLMRTPYDKSYAQHVNFRHPEWLAAQGFIVVVQDVRGRYRSEGKFRPFHYEKQDGADTIRCLRDLPKSNGRIGMYGFSYVGATQLQAAAEQPEGLIAIAPAFTNDGFYEDWSYKNGALHLAFLVSWSAMMAIGEAAHQGHYDEINGVIHNYNHICDSYDHLPVNDLPLLSRQFAPFYYEWLEHPAYDHYWKSLHIGQTYQDIRIPALHIGGWYDVFIEGTIRNFIGITEHNFDDTRNRQKLIIGPWSHGPWARIVGDIDFGEDAGNFINDVLARWFHYWLNGEDNGIIEEPAVSIFVMGANKWRHEYEWPLARTSNTRCYLHSGGAANSLSGDGVLDMIKPEREYPDMYIYNPGDPVPSIGGHSCCETRFAPIGPKDQRIVEIRNDVLVYTTGELEEEVEVTGPVEAVIYASSSAEDTDFTLKLVDVYPDGRAYNLIEGIQRASFRESNEHPLPIVPNRIYEYRFVVGHTSNLFQKGHRIRIEISSSNFPVFDRHLNVFKPDRQISFKDVTTATQKIYHDEDHPSHIILPIIPKGL